MNREFPEAVPEIPVENVDRAVDYYVRSFGFKQDWGGEEPEGIAGISKGNCRLFLTNRGFRQRYRNALPVVIWLNLYSTQEVDALHELWRDHEANIVSPPESKPWKLREFTAADLDGNLLKVFYDFSRDVVNTGEADSLGE